MKYSENIEEILLAVSKPPSLFKAGIDIKPDISLANKGYPGSPSQIFIWFHLTSRTKTIHTLGFCKDVQVWCVDK